jgi:hypothetical protein
MVEGSNTPQAVAADPHAYRPLLAGRARGPAVVVILLAIIVIAVLGMRYADQDTAGKLDLTLDAFIRPIFAGILPSPVPWSDSGSPHKSPSSSLR